MVSSSENHLFYFVLSGRLSASRLTIFKQRKMRKTMTSMLTLPLILTFSAHESNETSKFLFFFAAESFALPEYFSAVFLFRILLTTGIWSISFEDHILMQSTFIYVVANSFYCHFNGASLHTYH